jgi:hypothetical protein
VIVLVLRVDNKSAISLVKNPIHHDRTMNIDIKYYVIREYENTGQIEVQFIRTENRLGDILMKPLCKVKFSELIVKTGLKEVQ